MFGVGAGTDTEWLAGVSLGWSEGVADRTDRVSITMTKRIIAWSEQ